MIRRLVGVAHVPDFEAIADERVRAVRSRPMLSRCVYPRCVRPPTAFSLCVSALCAAAHCLLCVCFSVRCFCKCVRTEDPEARHLSWQAAATCQLQRRRGISTGLACSVSSTKLCARSDAQQRGFRCAKAGR